MRQILNKLIPFFVLAVAIIAFVFGLMLLAYLFLFGALVGVILFAVNKIRSYFKPPTPRTPSNSQQQTSGRIIDTDDYKELK